MKNKLITILSLICTSLLLSSCGTNNSSSSRIIKNFERDSYTKKISLSNYVSDDKTTIDNDNEYSGGYGDTLAEITLIGQDNSVTYDVIDGADIKYKGLVFKNLYANIQKIDTNYDKNTLINFLIKTFESKSSLIYTVLTTNTVEGADSDIEAVTFDEMLSGVDRYSEVKHKYDEEVSWMLQFIDSESRREVQIFGAKSYILLTANGVSSDIDMTKYDSSINNSDANTVSDEVNDAKNTDTSIVNEDTNIVGGEVTSIEEINTDNKSEEADDNE